MNTHFDVDSAGRWRHALLAALAFIAVLLLPAPPAHGAGGEGDTAAPSSVGRAVGAVVSGGPEIFAADAGRSFTAAEGRWSWPLEGAIKVVALYDPPEQKWGPGHRGIDITGSGSTVRAVEDGTVRFAGTAAGKPVVSVEHANGLISTYEPVIASVHRGDHVARGDQIGALATGSPFSHCTPTCLHIGAKVRDGYIDPRPLFGGARPSVLYPENGGRGR